MNVIWSPQAEARLQEIEDFIAQDSTDKAAEFITKLIERAKGLDTFPNSGRVVPEKASGELREVIEGNYRIVYRFKGGNIEIVTVFEGHRQFPEEDSR